MNYAIIEEGVVTNIIVLNDGNAQDFPGAAQTGGVPAAVGNAYSGGAFYREGEELLSPLEAATRTIAALDQEIVDLTYQNILLELEA